MQPCHLGEPWSEVYGSNAPNPVDPGDFVHIVYGQTVLLDETTVDLGGLWLEGTLVFDHTQLSGTVELRTAYAVVTGTLQIGCKSGSTITRFTKRTHLTLIAPENYSATTSHTLTAGVNWDSTIAATFGTSGKVYEAALDRGLVIAGTGKLFIYGNDSREQGWTTLAATVDPDEDYLLLSDPLAGAWRANDSVVIASTDFEYADQWIGGLGDGELISEAMRGGHPEDYVQGEERMIESLDTVNQAITVDLDLDHQHWSEAISATFASGDATIEERAEIANLTRSVVIRGEESSDSSFARGGTRHRGHVILLGYGSDTPYCEVDWAEFRYLGVEGKLGRYPFHWHMLGDAYASADHPYLRDCSIHHSVNRFVTVHNTKYVEVERNVGYDALGGGFFLEDADEDGNPLGDETQFVVLRDNLGMKVGRPTNHVAGYPTKYKEVELLDPSVFWIQHPNQIVEGNHAAGAAGHGFYLAPDRGLVIGFTHPASGASSFKNNVSHSNGQHGFYNNSRVEWDWQDNGSQEDDAPTAEGLVAWKNRRYGIWWRTHGVAKLQDCKMADNRSGFYPASGGRQDARDANVPPTCRLLFNGGVIFGETGNVGEAINPAELDVVPVRSLPQTYWHFKRPEVAASAAESAWGTLNAIEAYDGRNVITNLRLAYFPDARTLSNPDPSGSGTAVQVVAAITQTEYNSRYIEDPRNDVEDVEAATGSVEEEVVNLAGYRATGATLGLTMIRNTVVHDIDNSLGHGTDVYVCYNDRFFDANATADGTVDSARNLLIVPSSIADFAQFEVASNLQSASQKMTVEVDHQSLSLGTVDLLLASMPPEENQTDVIFGFNAPIGLTTSSEGVYRCTFGTLVPSEYTIKIQFAEAEDVPTIIGVPLAAKPDPLTVNGDDLLQFNEKSDLASLLATNDDHAFCYVTATSILYVRTTTIVRGANGLDLDGTRNVIKVNRP